MSERQPLDEHLADFANYLCGGGIGLMGLAFVIFYFIPHTPFFPLNAMDWCLILVFTVGTTMLVIGRTLMRKIVGRSKLDFKPITVTLFKR